MPYALKPYGNIYMLTYAMHIAGILLNVGVRSITAYTDPER